MKQQKRNLEIHQGVKNVQLFASSKGSNNRIISRCDTYQRLHLSNLYLISGKANLEPNHLTHHVLHSSCYCTRTSFCHISVYEAPWEIVDIVPPSFDNLWFPCQRLLGNPWQTPGLLPHFPVPYPHHPESLVPTSTGALPCCHRYSLKSHI